jgi:hypothetical protein
MPGCCLPVHELVALPLDEAVRVGEEDLLGEEAAEPEKTQEVQLDLKDEYIMIAYDRQGEDKVEQVLKKCGHKDD